MSINLNPELHDIKRFSQELLFEQILLKKNNKRSAVFQTQYSKFSWIHNFNFLLKKIIFLSNNEISKKLFFDFFVVDLNNLIFKKNSINFFFFEFNWDKF